jgi:hypothetical protein
MDSEYAKLITPRDIGIAFSLFAAGVMSVLVPARKWQAASRRISVLLKRISRSTLRVMANFLLLNGLKLYLCNSKKLYFKDKLRQDQ